MRILLDSEELNNELNRIISLLSSSCVPMFNTCQALYFSGVRFNELMHYNWKILNTDIYSIYTKKTKTFRILQKVNIPVEFLYYILTGSNEVFIDNIQKFNYYWNSLKLPLFSTDTEKDIRTHIFRYNFIRQLKENGNEATDIMKQIGHTQLNTTKSYINKSIYIDQ